MSKKQKILLFLLFMILVTPVVVFAQDNQPDIGDTQNTGFICERGDSLIKCIPRLYNFALGIAGLIAMAVLVAAGYLYMTAGGNGQQLDTAKKMIGGVFAGIVLLVTAYILLEFLDPRFVSLELKTPLSTSTGSTTSTTSTNGTTTGAMTDSAARAMLANAGITVNAPEPQTSLSGIKADTIQEIIRLKKDCETWHITFRPGVQCEVVVTGGTETGHAPGSCSHSSGNKIDLRVTNSLDNYITSIFTSSGTRNGDPKYIAPNRNIYVEYVRELSHWDISVGCSG